MCEIILVSFKFGDFLQNRQFTELKTLPKFPTIRYVTGVYHAHVANHLNNIIMVLAMISYASLKVACTCSSKI